MIIKLYLITDRKLFSNKEVFFNTMEEALEAGIRAVQLREKDIPSREILDMAYRLRALTSRYKAMLFINDRIDIALCVGADGVHLGQASLPASAVRKIVRRTMLIGVSTHSLKEALEAERDGADFITFGPVYQTPSKMKYGKPIGVEALRDLRKNISIPIIGIGGINLDNAEEVINAGADGVAMIRGVLSTTDIKNAVKKYLKILGEER